MSTYPTSVIQWDQPAFVGADQIPHIVVNGAPITQQGMEIEFGRERELPAMSTASGLSIVHHLAESTLAPLTTDPLAVNGSVTQPSEQTRNALELAANLTGAGRLSIWFDFPTMEIWISDGSTTTLTTSRPFPWATLSGLGVTPANRPARAYLSNTLPGNELGVVYAGTPGASEVLIDGAIDGTSVVLGAAPAAGTEIIVLAHWLRTGRFTVDHSRENTAVYSIDFEFEELVLERSFE